ncbi:MAG: hypothetical protein ACXVAY_10080 [Mucilaginibacter sp.]
MKTIINTLTCLTLFVCLSFCARAQAIPDTARLAIGLEAGLPEGNINLRYTMSLGASARFDLPISKKSFLTASVGFNNFFLADGSTTTQMAILNVPVQTLKTLPVKLGYKYYLGKHFYTQLELGETVLLNEAAVYATKSYAFTWAPQIGVMFPLSNHNFIDAGIRYEGVSSFYNDTDKYSFWGLHISYSFKL